MKAFAALLASASLAASGCGTLFAANQVTIPVASANPGAQVLVDGFPAGATPTMITVEAHHSHIIMVRGAGGAGVCRLDPTIGAGWVILDFVAGVWPLVVDLVTGDWAGVDDGSCFVPV